MEEGKKKRGREEEEGHYLVNATTASQSNALSCGRRPSDGMGKKGGEKRKSPGGQNTSVPNFDCAARRVVRLKREGKERKWESGQKPLVPVSVTLIWLLGPVEHIKERGKEKKEGKE